MKPEHKKIAALVGAGLIAGAAIGGAVGVVSQQPDINSLSAELSALKAQEPEVVIETVETLVEVPVEVETIVEVPVEVEKIVEVESGNMSIVLDAIFDNGGDVEFLLDDLDDDELDQIVDRVLFVNESKALAVAAIKTDLFDELDGEEVNGTELDEDDMERLKIDDDADEILISDVDFEDGDALLIITGSFEQDDEEFSFEAEVSIKDGKVDEIESILVEKEE